MPVSASNTPNPSERSYAGMIPPRESDDRRALLIHAWSQMAQQHWDTALNDLAQQERLGPAGRMAQRTALNMRAMRKHRPAVYQQLFKLFPIDLQNRHYRPVRAKGGWMTIVVRTIEGDHLLNHVEDPHAAAQRDVAKMADPFKHDIPLMLCGLADGYFFEALARQPRAHDDGRVTALYLAEPEPDLLLANLALHDFSGKNGPIASPWVEWIVGANWHDQFIVRLDHNWMLPVPGLVLGNKQMHGPVKEALARIKAHRKQNAATSRDASVQHDAYAQPAKLAANLRGQSGNPPKALLIDSRFTPAAPGAIDQIDDGFNDLGWETHRLVEEAPHHRMSPLAVWRTLGQVRPDLIVDIGGQWADRRDVIDRSLPVVRWLADGTTSKKPTADRADLSPRDFVLAQVSPLAGGLKGYPARQVLPMPGVVSIQGNLRQTAAADPDNATTDLLYIGDHAGEPRVLLEEIAQRLANPRIRQLAQIVGEQMLDDYREGKNYPTRWHIDQIARQCTAQVKGLKLSDKLYRQLANIMFAPFNETLYREQALRWAAQVADELGLTLALHGRGWKRCADLAAYAHGRPPSEPHRDQLTASARINLHVAPTFCLDEKLMQGLAVGGFFLVREHPADTLLPEMVGFLENNCDPAAQNVGQARSLCNPKYLPQLERLLERAQWITDIGDGLDPIACVRACLRGGLLDRHHVALPRLDQAQFGDAQQLKQRIERFLKAPAKRLDIVRKQRAAIEHRLSFSSGLARSITRIAELIEAE
ncbi:MAG: hypothetical protein ACIAXF_11465 [Phycisphaerales bacterium JB063]